MFDRIAIVGAGFCGATIARYLAEKGHRITVFEKRDHIGGNAYDYTNEHGIRIHKYGPHLFHTNNKRVYDWLSRFTEWLPYKHQVRALLDNGDTVVLPPNKHTIDYFGSKDKMFDKLFRPYTKKMWDRDIDELDPSIINRIKIRDDDNTYYFPNDAHQCVPKDGYTRLFERMLDHKNIIVHTRSPVNKNIILQWDYVFNSMPIDEYFNFCHGHLEYRSIRFTHVTKDSEWAWDTANATMNFTTDDGDTRMTEWKKIPGHGVNNKKTTITYERPVDYRDNMMERYYPVKDVEGKNRALYEKYDEMASEIKNMEFIGRCGKYVYIDMHQAVNMALQTGERYENSRHSKDIQE